MNLFPKFMVIVKNELGKYGMIDFDGLDDQEIIAFNLNLKAKLIRPLSYQVKESAELISKLGSLSSDHKVAYNEIQLKLTIGEDINPFLSQKAIDPAFHDYLLLDWNIHHLHLNHNNSGGYFNDRSDYLLMVLFDKGVAHFIDVERHDDNEVFVKREYLKIIKDNWPDIIEGYELKGALDTVPHNPTNEEIKRSRKNQINTCLKIDDKVYGAIGGGITSAGYGANYICKAMQWERYIDSIEMYYQAKKQKILDDIAQKTGVRFADLDLDFDYYDARLVLIDKNSKLILEEMGV